MSEHHIFGPVSFAFRAPAVRPPTSLNHWRLNMGEALLFDALPVFPVALPADELALLASLEGCDWPTNQEVAWEERAAARRLEARGLIKVSRQKMDPVADEPTWFAGRLPAAGVRAAAAMP
jgi:hypothetical protein